MEWHIVWGLSVIQTLYKSMLRVYPLPEKILAMAKLKAYADDKFDIT